MNASYACKHTAKLRRHTKARAQYKMQQFHSGQCRSRRGWARRKGVVRRRELLLSADCEMKKVAGWCSGRCNAIIKRDDESGDGAFNETAPLCTRRLSQNCFRCCCCKTVNTQPTAALFVTKFIKRAACALSLSLSGGA